MHDDEVAAEAANASLDLDISQLQVHLLRPYIASGVIALESRHGLQLLEYRRK